MKEKISTNKILALTSLVFGILSLFSFVLYFYSANHAPYTYIDVIFWGPLCSFIGIVISIITRKTRKIHPALWISGIISCMLGFIVCMFVFSMLIVLMAAKQVLKPRDELTQQGKETFNQFVLIAQREMIFHRKCICRLDLSMWIRLKSYMLILEYRGSSSYMSLYSNQDIITVIS